MRYSQIEQGLGDQFRQLVVEGNEILQMAQHATSHVEGEDLARVSAWVVSTKRLLGSLYLDGGPYLKEFNEVMQEHGNKSSHLGTGFYDLHSEHCRHLAATLGILKGAYNDFKAGRLKKLDTLLRLEVFSDITEAAKHLLEKGYKDPAAVMLGGILELSIKQIASELGIPLRKENGAPKELHLLNDEIAKKGHYDGLVKQQITSWAKLRNHAAHVEYDQYTADQVRQMHQFLENFCSEYL